MRRAVPSVPALSRLSRREYQIVQATYARRSASVTQILESINDPPSRTAVRTILRILEEKGHLRHRTRGREFIYYPVLSRSQVGLKAFRHVLHTFFDDSLEKAVATHIARPKRSSRKELDQLLKLVRKHTQPTYKSR